MCLTPEALDSLLRTVGVLEPESGAKGFGPKDAMGFDVVEFDKRGSARASGAVYSPDVSWGDSRIDFHISKPGTLQRLWTGDLHSHPGYYGRPSPKSGVALGDLGYVEEVFNENEWMEWFFVPILTATATEEVVIHPWICSRSSIRQPMIGELVVCEASRFPERLFNTDWQARVEEEKAAKEHAEKPEPADEKSEPAQKNAGGDVSESTSGDSSKSQDSDDHESSQLSQNHSDTVVTSAARGNATERGGRKAQTVDRWV